MDINLKIRKNLKRIIAEKGFIKQDDFVLASGKKKQQISDILTGKVNIGKKLQEEFAEVLGVKVSDFYKDIDDETVCEENIASDNIQTGEKEEDIRTKLLKQVGYIIQNGSKEHLSALCSIAEGVIMDINEQKKAAPTINAPVSKGRKVA